MPVSKISALTPAPTIATHSSRDEANTAASNMQWHAGSINDSRRQSLLVDAISSPQEKQGFFSRVATGRAEKKKKRISKSLGQSQALATNEILGGLRRYSFVDVHKGLKRLHTAEQKLRDHPEIEEHKIDTYASITCKDVASRLDDTQKYYLRSMLKLKDRRMILRNYVDLFSDKKKLFHRMLVKLNNFGLMPFQKYFNAREERIAAMDQAIGNSLLKILLHTNIGLTNEEIEALDDEARQQLFKHMDANSGPAALDSGVSRRFSVQVPSRAPTPSVIIPQNPWVENWTTSPALDTPGERDEEILIFRESDPGIF